MQSSKSSFKEVIDRIFSTHRITKTAQQLLMRTLLSQDILSSYEREQIDRVFDALRRGLLRVVD